MLRIVIISVLLTIVYSWDEFKRSVRVLLYGLFRRRHPLQYYARNTDRLVSVLVMVATIPIGLTYIMFGPGSSAPRLGWMSLGLFSISLIAAGSGIFIRRLRLTEEYEGVGKVVPVAFSVAGLLTPTFQFLGGFASLPRKTMGKLAFLLSLPPLLGFLMQRFSTRLLPEELLPNMNVLISVLVVAFLARLTADFLETSFRLYRLEKVFSYFRVVLGIALAAILLH